jgi:hypothetical protein
MRKPCTWLVVVLLGGMPLAGCGGSSNSKSGTGTNTTGSQSSEASGGKGSSGGTSSSGATSSSGGLIAKQQVEACKHVIQAPSPLSASTKAKLEKSCEKVGGSRTAQRALVHEVCEALASRQPAGVARERALAICRRAP